jgi:uncharacterized RDD family membrane protein YckC
MTDPRTNLGGAQANAYTPNLTTVCTACGGGYPAGSRYCPICHASVLPGLPGVLASPAKRLAAHLIDMFLPMCAVIALGGWSAYTGHGGLFVVAMVGYAVWAIYLFTRGTTPGKNMLGMDVVDEHGQPASVWRMMLREWIGKFISSVVFGLGFLWILFDRDRQGWHDKLASTYVVVRPFRD